MLEMKKKTGKIIDKFGKEMNEKIPEKHVHFQKEKNKKIPKMFNKEFKPSGKFIYGDDILSNIKEIL